MGEEKLRRRPGRPSALTPEVQKIILDLVAQGATIKDATEAAGIDVSTLHKNKGREDFVGFFQALTHAKASLRSRVAASLAEHEDWRARAWYLERVDREQWGKRETLEHEFPELKGRKPEELMAEIQALVRKSEGKADEGGE